MGSFRSKIKGLVLSFDRAHKWRKYIPITQSKESKSLLKGKTALIAGGLAEIDSAIANKFIACGCNVIVAGLYKSANLQICGEFEGKSRYLVVNVTDINSLGGKIEEASKIYGSIDILVCNYGVHITKRQNDFLSVTEKEYDDVMNMSLRGTYFLCQSMAKYMITNKIKGHILIISSYSKYLASSRLANIGLDGITEGIAQSLLPHNIIVNGLNIGYITTTNKCKEVNGRGYTSEGAVCRCSILEAGAEYANVLVSDLGNTIIGQTIYLSS